MLPVGSSRQLQQAAALAIAALGIHAFIATACEPAPPSVDAPSFEATNPYYRIFFNDVEAAVVRNGCQGSLCSGRGQNNIASITMDDAYTPITVLVEKVSHDPAKDGIGWNIRPTHLQDAGIVRDVELNETTGDSISFTVSHPCQISVELGDEEALSATEEAYFGFANLIVAVNPPESSWPRQKPTITVDPNTGELKCESADPDRLCVVGTADHDCCGMEVEADTDLYFTSRLRKSYRWLDGCGAAPKVIHLHRNAAIFLDDDVVVFAHVFSDAENTGIYGYGVLSNYYMHGGQDLHATAGIVALHRQATIFGPILMDSTHGNIAAGRNSTVAWTKSFAFEPLTDGITLYGYGSSVHDNFFKVNGDTLKAYQSHTTYSNNVIWHQTNGAAVRLSWGIWRDNQADKDSTTRVVNTSVIHDYSYFIPVPSVSGWLKYALQAGLANYGTLISAQHSMSNFIGSEESPVIIKGFQVEGKVSVLLALSSGYKDIMWKSPWQDSDGCGGAVNVRIEDLDLSRVRAWGERKSLVASCKLDHKYDDIENMDCQCTSELQCFDGDKWQTACRSKVWFENLVDSTVPGVATLKSKIRTGNRGHTYGL